MLKEVLQKFFSLDGVSSAMIIRKDGEVLETVGSVVMDQSEVGAIVSFVMAESRAMATELGQENLSMVFVEFRDKALMSVPISEELYLIAIANSSSNIAKISLELKKNRDILLSLV